MRASVEEHAAHIAALVGTALETDGETVALDEALGRVTRSAVLSPVDLPLFRNSQMDGFAVRAADLVAVPVRLTVTESVPAGAVARHPVEPGSAVRIMTGAAVPEGADAIVPIEDTEVDGATVTIRIARAAGEYVRERGSDLRAGDSLVPAGVRLRSRHLAALAASGLIEVAVRARPRIAIITSGSEIVAPGEDLGPGRVYDSNATALDAAIRSVGAVVASRRHVADDVVLFRAALTDAVASADVIITSGGISMGDHEVVRQTLEPLGARVGTVAMQPGGPQATAVFDGTPVLCFPGNPVSTQLSFELFLAPLLREVAGLPRAVREPRALAADVRSVAGKRQFLRGRALDDGRVEQVGGPSSHLVAALAASDLLIEVPAEVTVLAAGELVQTWAL